MITEAFNSVRRIYTDGRDHLPEEERYPPYITATPSGFGMGTGS